MPYYRWKGVDLFGSIRYGYMRCLSIEELKQELLLRDIALLKAYTKKKFLCVIKESDKIFFFQRLKSLLEAGVHLHDALKIIASKTNSPRLADIIERLCLDVERGVFLHDALSRYPRVFEPLMIDIWRLGQKGTRDASISLLCRYLEERYAIKKKLKRAALIPAITGCLFVVILFSIILFIMPRFEDMFLSLKIELPWFTQKMLSISYLIRENFSSYMSGLFLVSFFGMRFALRNKKVKWLIDGFLLKVPYIRALVIERDLYIVFKTLGLLLQARMPLDQASESAVIVVQNIKLRLQFQMIVKLIKEGVPLNQALEYVACVDDELLALITVGQQSGRLAELIVEAGNLCHERMSKRLDLLTNIIQPLLIVVLAFSIVGLMLAVYVPILTLSQSI